MAAIFFPGHWWPSTAAFGSAADEIIVLVCRDHSSQSSKPVFEQLAEGNRKEALAECDQVHFGGRKMVMSKILLEADQFSLQFNIEIRW
ncbi:hypothetical protein A8V01_23430 [Novosphingobium guangzhouense]|uniref:Uncharacterized protein n=1 Tax=Novosphingobium guangzhouense TaxID=1850347 RepID=A0A2K2FXQ0_9SPHN|nr:hypothetical protein A8V01_23430 [Novosphingobium guangzhouense]